ncbi:hypothetical protein HDA32_005304 [Spinactinospora alkalitolerans]|uniref:Uncharacterized protein n=1 Tax=Spinactinospora alkalitolerans TaxID=687207 RepID=A0A852U7Z6_9ACTN|nr:hypothetical protein [Spinactinospora alkalitolerans]NYE50184.1 hypothetical protein [Spinactinospora alkalitolerans]
MSSFSGWACFDLLPDQDSQHFLRKVRDLPALADEEAHVLVRDRRVFLLFPRSPLPLTDAGAALVPGAAARAVVATDFDEYGVINEIIDSDGKTVHQAAIDEQDSGIPENDDSAARRRAAALFGVDRADLDEVSRTWDADGARPSVLGTPYLRWWDALGVPWPEDFADGAVPLP